MSDTMTEPTETQEPETAETGETGSETVAEKKERAKTTYFTADTMEALDDLPENPKVVRQGGGRSKIYHGLLETIAEAGVDNKWRPLARFGTSSGAKTVALALNRQVAGEVGEDKGQVKPDQVKDIPEYEGFRWVFDSRRVPSEDDPAKIESVLYAKLVEDKAA